jgi:phage shock protein PspC (stress-responsive transcriptional regulator)
MQKVVTINLNGNAYQIDEAGYAGLVAYLEAADRQLAGNPDRAEILADLEQAIADKCRAFLGPHKTVVTAAEVDRIIREMGPVDGEAGAAAQAATAAGSSSAGTRPSAPRRLYLIHEGAMLAGVCNGLAAYLGIDVTIVRIVFLGLALVTKGGFVLVYLGLAFVIPSADTSEERAAARGQPFNAQELIDRAKRNYADFKSSHGWRSEQREWRRTFRENMRGWRGGWWSAPPYPPSPAAYPARMFAGLMVPVLTLASVALFWVWLFAIFSLVTQQEVFGLGLPDDVPLWLAVVILVVAYQAVVWPLHLVRRSSYYAIGGAHHGAVAALDGALSLGLTIFAIWLAVHYVPELRELLRSLPDVFRSLRDSVAT